MTMSMPPKITAATGMDALTHAVEAYIGPQKNPISDAFASAAMELIRHNLIPAVTDGSNKDIRLAMANAAMLAGLAFSNSMVGVVHATAHATGGVCHVPHGIANSILLPYGLEFYLEKSSQVQAYIETLLLPLAGPDIYVQTPPGERAAKAVTTIRTMSNELKKLCGLPTRLSEAGVTEDQLDSIAEKAINDGAISFSPVEVSLEEARKILKAAF